MQFTGGYENGALFRPLEQSDLRVDELTAVGDTTRR
jgi:hypothetical protein